MKFDVSVPPVIVPLGATVVRVPGDTMNARPDRPLVFVMLIQKLAPMPDSTGENQLPGKAVPLTPAPSVVKPLPLNRTDAPLITSPCADGFATYGVNGLPCQIGV